MYYQGNSHAVNAQILYLKYSPSEPLHSRTNTNINENVQPPGDKIHGAIIFIDIVEFMTEPQHLISNNVAF